MCAGTQLTNCFRRDKNNKVNFILEICIYIVEEKLFEACYINGRMSCIVYYNMCLHTLYAIKLKYKVCAMRNTKSNRNSIASKCET